MVFEVKALRFGGDEQGSSMASKSTFEQVWSVLRLIIKAQRTEEGVCRHFGSTSTIAACANSTTGAARVLLIAIAKNFSEGLRLSYDQLYRIAKLQTYVHYATLPDFEALSDHLNKLTDGLILDIKPEDNGYTMSFNQSLLNNPRI